MAPASTSEALRSPVAVTVPATAVPSSRWPASVTVPAVLPVAVSENGCVSTAGHAQIINDSDGAVVITGISVYGENGWSVVPFWQNMASEKVDSRKIGFKVNNACTDQVENNESELALNPWDWRIEQGSVLPLSYDAVVSATSVPFADVQVLTVIFVIAWAE